MTSYIPVTNRITPEWLTAILHQAGVLKRGEVKAVEVETTEAFNSHTSHLLLGYSGDTPHGVPIHLVLKRNIQEFWGVEAGAEEVKFYTLVASLPDHPDIIVPCYAAAYDEESGESYLLLKDLSETHRSPVVRAQQVCTVEGIPPAPYIEAVVDTLARLHAYWWEHPLLKKETFEVGYWCRTAERFEVYTQRRTAAWNRLIADEGAWFPDDLRELVERVLARLPQHWERYLKPRFQHSRHLTLTHGDAYFANFLCPKQPGSGPTYLLDWQSPSFDIGGYDLVNLCATFWTPEQRQEGQREEKILRHYLRTLQAHGVNNYSWDELVTDYRIGLIFWLLLPAQDRLGGSRKDYWWPKLQCLAAAFRDWRCEDLLGI